ncbi:uncharacterized protein EI97DRAFT_264054 [Westerdykella ornata]|uniref:Uncharacterized protein n=1 Tax=Westerdykella ornata TaxID=318751 RepID=A0A6A6J639_WESOR|nr:uncharacterized protein EI97DRAFT_264054 [Westerdykella ornata]KAF2271603.1 hypothetical protein EI97DRAFT_264054 [Westerdykella ornata]
MVCCSTSPHIRLGEKAKKKMNHSVQRTARFDVGQIRTDAPEGTRFLVLRDNHSATTPLRMNNFNP